MGIVKTIGALLIINFFIFLHLFIWVTNISLKRLHMTLMSITNRDMLKMWFSLLSLNGAHGESSTYDLYGYTNNEIYSEFSHLGFLSPIRFFIAGIVPLVVALLGLYKKSLSFSGFVSAFLVGFILTLASYSLSFAMITFFLVASKATKFRAAQKKAIDKDAEEGSQRTLVQVVCNGGIPCELALIYVAEYWSDAWRASDGPLDFDADYTGAILKVAALGAIACSCGDTLASELGPVWPRSAEKGKARPWPVLITTGSVVPPGTNGGVTLVGLFFSALGGLVVGLAYYTCSRFLSFWAIPTVISGSRYSAADQLSYDKEWLVIPLATMAGYLGSIIDSILGATFQYTGYDTANQRVISKPGTDRAGRTEKMGPIIPVVRRYNYPLLDNHAVNLLSSLITAFITPVFAVALWNAF